MNNGSQLSCAGCKKDEREAAKAQIQQEEQQMHAEFARQQEEIFRKAQAALDEELRTGFAAPATTDHSQLEASINSKAKALAKEYCNAQPGSDYDQTYLVYKFTNSPVELLVQGMSSMGPDQLSQFYRKLARQLHPDKNCHPDAKEAFQRVQEAHATAKAQIPAASASFSC